MTAADARQRFEEIEAAFADLDVHRFEWMEPYAGGARAAKTVAKALGHPAPDDLAALYAEADGLHLEWHASVPGRRLSSGGTVAIMPSDGVAGAMAEGRTRLPDAEGVPFVFEPLSHYHAVVADVTPEATALWLVLPDGRAARLPVSPVEYAERAVALGGLDGWQFRLGPEAGALLDGLSGDRFAQWAAAFVPDAALDGLAVEPSGDEVPPLQFRPLLDAARDAGAEVRAAPPARDGAVRWAEITARSRLPDDLLAFVREANGVRLSWSEGGRSGGFRIESLERMVGGAAWARANNGLRTAAAELSLPASSPLADWLLLYQAEEQIVVAQLDPARLAVADRDGVRPLRLGVGAFVEAAVRHGGDPAWFRSLDGGEAPPPVFDLPGA